MIFNKNRKYLRETPVNHDGFLLNLIKDTREISRFEEGDIISCFSIFQTIISSFLFLSQTKDFFVNENLAI